MRLCVFSENSNRNFTGESKIMGQNESKWADASFINEPLVIPDSGAVLGFGQTVVAESGALTLLDETIVHVSSYCGHHVFVCASGRAYSVGDNFCGQLGLGTIGDPVGSATQITALEPFNEPIVMSACGDKHTLLLSARGSVFACGDNKDGQLSLANMNSIHSPVPVFCPPRVKQVAAGYSHSIALTERGDVWVWGSNKWGELGLGDDNKRIVAEQLRFVAGPVKFIAAGYLQSAFITARGALYKCGRNEKGELGVPGFKGNKSMVPQLVDLPVPVIAVTIGEEHSLALTAEGHVYAWGDNWYGQCGPKEAATIDVPRKLSLVGGHRIVQIAAEYLSSALVTDKGQLLTFGLDSYGQLCHGGPRRDRDVPAVVETFSHLVVKQVSCGTAHTLVLAMPLCEDIIKRQEQEEEENYMVEREQRLNEKEERITERELRTKLWEKRLKDCETRLNEREKKMNEREDKMDEREKRMDEKERGPITILPTPIVKNETRFSFRRKKKNKVDFDGTLI